VPSPQQKARPPRVSAHVRPCVATIEPKLVSLGDAMATSLVVSDGGSAPSGGLTGSVLHATAATAATTAAASAASAETRTRVSRGPAVRRGAAR